MEDEPDVESARPPATGLMRLLGSWPLNLVVALFFCLSLPKVLSSSVPLSAVVYPGFFVVPAIWLTFTHFAGWDGNRRPVAALVPLGLYFVSCTALMFVLYFTRDDRFYIREAWVSMLFSVPVGLATAFILWKRNDPRLRPPTADSPKH